MESGLDGRNNRTRCFGEVGVRRVSMESGLDGRNNRDFVHRSSVRLIVSMESGLDGRNNAMGVGNAFVDYNLSQWSPA